MHLFQRIFQPFLHPWQCLIFCRQANCRLWASLTASDVEREPRIILSFSMELSLQNGSKWRHDWSSQLYTQLKQDQNGEFHNCLSWVYNCDDQSCLRMFLRSSNIWSFVYSFAEWKLRLSSSIFLSNSSSSFFFFLGRPSITVKTAEISQLTYFKIACTWSVRSDGRFI